MNTLNTDTSIALYNQLADTIRNDIRDGKFQSGEKIPSEFELSDSYKVSRSTVRKAISVLVSEKLLVKLHGKGTFVSSSKVSHPSSFLSFTENVESMGKILTTKVIEFSHVLPNEKQQTFFQISENDPLLMVKRLRKIDNLPICIETTWFSSKYDSLQEKDLNGSLYQVLLSDYQIRPFTGSKTIELCYASEEEAELLDVPRGLALMLVVDNVFDDLEEPLHITKQVVRGDKFKYALK